MRHQASDGAAMLSGTVMGKWPAAFARALEIARQGGGVVDSHPTDTG
jgi:hypothetical protein